MKLTRFRGDNEPIVLIVKADGVVADITGSTITLYYADKSIVGVLTDAPNGKVTFNPSGTDFQTVGQFKYKVVKIDGTIRKTIVKNIIVINDDSVL